MQALGNLRELLTKPQRPTLRACFTGSFGLYRRILSSPMTSLAIALCAWTYPDARIKQVLRVGVYILALAAGEAILAYLWRWRKYLKNTEKQLSFVRSAILKNANFNENELGSVTFNILGLSEDSGGVLLVVQTPEQSGLKKGSLLSVVVTATDEVWGTVEILDFVAGNSRARPVNRAKVEFWDGLEDRMRSEPSAPEGIHLEPAIHREVPDILGG